MQAEFFNENNESVAFFNSPNERNIMDFISHFTSSNEQFRGKVTNEKISDVKFGPRKIIVYFEVTLFSQPDDIYYFEMHTYKNKKSTN